MQNRNPMKKGWKEALNIEDKKFTIIRMYSITWIFSNSLHYLINWNFSISKSIEKKNSIRYRSNTAAILSLSFRRKSEYVHPCPLPSGRKLPNRLHTMCTQTQLAENPRLVSQRATRLPIQTEASANPQAIHQHVDISKLTPLRHP